MGLVEARLVPEAGDPIPFLFNPTELAYTLRRSWTPPNVKNRNPNPGEVIFAGPAPGSMSLSLLFDATITGGKSIKAWVSDITRLVSVDPTLTTSADGAGRPPSVKVEWGPVAVPFKAVVEQLQVRYTLFAEDGTPLRVRCDLTLKEFGEKIPGGKGDAVDPSSSVVGLPSGGSLSQLAAAAYGDPSAWRGIAAANGITDPMRPPTGMPLTVPPLPALRPRG